MSIVIVFYFGFISEVKRKDAIAAANGLTQALVDHLNVGWVGVVITQLCVQMYVKHFPIQFYR